MSICISDIGGGIIRGIDCVNKIIPGIKPNAYIFNHDDIDLANTEMADGTITKLVLKEGKFAFRVESLDNGFSATQSFSQGTFFNGFIHSITLRIFDNTPRIKKFVDSISQARIVAVIENNYIKFQPTAPDIKGDNVFEVYGFHTGLRTTESSRDTQDADTKGAYVITFSTEDSASEPTTPRFLFIDDGGSGTGDRLEQTRQALEELLPTP